MKRITAWIMWKSGNQEVKAWKNPDCFMGMIWKETRLGSISQQAMCSR
jgi:hypothetical protein